MSASKAIPIGGHARFDHVEQARSRTGVSASMKAVATAESGAKHRGLADGTNPIRQEQLIGG